MAEPLMDLLASLPEAAPSPERAARVRRRCRTRLERRARPGSTRPRSAASWPAVQAWRPLVAALGLAYVADVIVTAVGVLRGH